MSNPRLIKRVQQCRARWQSAPEGRSFAPLADALRQSGAYDEAISLLEDGLVRHPDFQAAMVILGFTFVDAGRREHGRKILQTVLKMDPENLLVLDWLIEDACGRSAWEEAVPMLEQMVKVEPDTLRWSQSLTHAREQFVPKNDGAAAVDTFVTMTLVDIYLAQGYHGKARDALLRMQRQEPDRRDIVEKLTELAGVVAESAGDVQDHPSLEVDSAGDARKRAEKRAAEKTKFAEWLGRIESDEGASP